MSHRCSFHFVRLWQELHQSAPTIQQRVLAVSPEHAVVQVMKEHHLKAAARVYVSATALETPSLRLACVIVKGNKRSWKHEL
jgi:hypothetical protein